MVWVTPDMIGILFRALICLFLNQTAQPVVPPAMSVNGNKAIFESAILHLAISDLRLTLSSASLHLPPAAPPTPAAAAAAAAAIPFLVKSPLVACLASFQLF